MSFRVQISEESASVILTTLCGASLVAALIFHSDIAAYAAIAFGSVHAFRSAWETIKERQLDVNTLMLLAAVGSIMVGLPFEAGILLFLFALSAALELYTLGRTTSAIEGLIKLRPDKARVVRNGVEDLAPIGSVQIGEIIRVLPFESIPIDAEIVEGESAVNEAAMTGESVPSPKSPGDRILAGTQNMAGSLLARTTAAAGDTALDKVVSLVRQAQEDRSTGQKISAWFGSRYTIFVVVVFAVTLAVRLLAGQDWNHAFYASLAVFVALSPCALVIAAPSASLSALAWAARHGLLLKGAQVIEEAGRVESLAVDKTGTLTQGAFRLVRAWEEGGVEWRGGDWSDSLKAALNSTAALEAHSTHPVASAIVAAAAGTSMEASSVEVVPGMGMRGQVDGRSVEAGQARLFPDAPQAVLDKASEYQADGLTVAIAREAGRFAVFGVVDSPRPEAAAALDSLRKLGIKRVIMLTGDSEPTAKSVARAVGVEEVKASLLPADKEAFVAGLAQDGAGVMFVGDGVNDAPSLARAQVGVAMGGLGSDIALNAAQAILMKDSLNGLVQLRSLGLKTNAIVKGSLFFAAAVVCILFVGSFAADAWLPADMRRIILPIAVMGHEGSTVLVILNGLRLLRGPGAKSAGSIPQIARLSL